MALALATPATCSAASVARPGPLASPVAIAPDDGGGALLSWTTRTPPSRALQVARVDSGLRPTPVETLAAARTISTGFVAPLPRGGAQALFAVGTTFAPTMAQVRLRPEGAAGFGPALGVLDGDYIEVLSAAGNARGALAAIVSRRSGNLVLLTAAPGQALGNAQSVAPDGSRADTAAVAVGSAGEITVVFHDGVSRVWVRQGTAGSPLGPAAMLTTARNRPDFSAAYDDAGTVTVAFSRNLPGNAIGVVAARARSGRKFAAPVLLDRGPNAQAARVAAAGRRTAVAWLALTERESVRVSSATGARGFERPEKPAIPTVDTPGQIGWVGTQANWPHVAVNERGDVVLAYAYGPFGAVHTALRRDGEARFARPRVQSTLGRGGEPAVAFLADGSPLVAWSDDEAVFASRLRAGVSPSATPPSATITPLDAEELRSRGTVTTTIRCATSCEIAVHARLTTGRGRNLVISRRGGVRRTLTAGGRATLRYELTPSGRARLASSGRAKAILRVTVANQSGLATGLRAAVEYDCARARARCPSDNA